MTGFGLSATFEDAGVLWTVLRYVHIGRDVVARAQSADGDLRDYSIVDVINLHRSYMGYNAIRDGADRSDYILDLPLRLQQRCEDRAAYARLAIQGDLTYTDPRYDPSRTSLHQRKAAMAAQLVDEGYCSRATAYRFIDVFARLGKRALAGKVYEKTLVSEALDPRTRAPQQIVDIVYRVLRGRVWASDEEWTPHRNAVFEKLRDEGLEESISGTLLHELVVAIGQELLLDKTAKQRQQTMSRSSRAKSYTVAEHRVVQQYRSSLY